jgi:cysteinyl-tRNA synthetase
MLQYVNPETRLVEKMSKSLGNVVTIDNFLKQYDADVFRLIVLGSYYRNPLTYNADIAADNARKLDRILGALLPAVGVAAAGPPVDTLAHAVTQARESFLAAMDSDFNSAGALASLFELVRAINVARDSGVGGTPFAAAQAELRELAGVLGLRLSPQQSSKSQDVAPFIELLIELRASLRKAKQFELSDLVRKRLSDLGVTLEDSPQGTRWKL